MVAALAWLPLATGVLLSGLGARAGARLGPTAVRWTFGGLALLGVLGSLALAWIIPVGARWELAWGPSLQLHLQVTPLVHAMTLLVSAIAAAVVLWAAAHEDREGLHRLLGGLTAFVGAMQLLVLAADLLTLTIGWELVSALSWLLIGHRQGDEQAQGSANYAYIVTRMGGLGLLVAAGAALAGAGSLRFEALPEVAGGAWGGALVAGLLVAAASKSAQLPFSPWLFRAMDGPSSVSALLHSSSMVAAGAWILLRLQPALDLVPWFGPACLGLGLSTAIGAGWLACVQSHAKRLLAASTAAQYGLCIAAVGAGSSAAAMVHVITHAALKALLFLAAGTAMTVAGTAMLRQMRVGRRLPFVAAMSAIAALALAGVPPLGAAWSKEHLVAATSHASLGLGLLSIAAATFSAWYAMRFQRLAFGRNPAGEGPQAGEWAVRIAVAVLALYTLGCSVLWWPAANEAFASALRTSFPPSRPWELVVSIGLVVLVGSAAWVAFGPGRGVASFVPARRRAILENWVGLSAGLDRFIAAPAFTLARVSSAIDDAVVDAGLEGAGRLGRWLSGLGARVVEVGVEGAVVILAGVSRALAAFSRQVDDSVIDRGASEAGHAIGWSGRRAPAIQTGAVPTYYVLLVGGLVAFVIFLGVWR